jgi:hypothetical protein
MDCGTRWTTYEIVLPLHQTVMLQRHGEGIRKVQQMEPVTYLRPKEHP